MWSYRLAILSLSSGWLRPLINLISFAISADMARKNSGRRPDDGDHQVFFFASSCRC